MTVAGGRSGAGPDRNGRSSGRPGAVSVTRCNGAGLVVLVGDVAAREADQLRARLADVLDATSPNVVVDASAVTWMSDDVVELLDEVASTITGSRGQLVVVDPPPGLVRRLRGCGVTVRTSAAWA